MTNFGFNTGVPATANNPSVDQPSMLINNQSTSGLLAIDHIGFNANNGGQHKQVTFNNDPLSGYPFIPSLPTAFPTLFTDTVNGLSQLKFYSGNAAQTSNQYVSLPNGSTMAMFGIIIKWFKVSQSLDTTYSYAALGINNFPNNVFSVSVSSDRTGVVFAPVNFTTTGIRLEMSITGVATTAYVMIIGN